MAFLPPPQQRQPRVFKERNTPNCRDYKSQFRFTEQSVMWLAEVFLGRDTGETRGGALSNKQKMEITLRYMADPGFQNGLSVELGVSQPTVSRTVTEVVEAICFQASDWIKFPRSTAEFDQKALDWQTKRTFPLAFGVVDGSLVKIQKPARQYNPSEYFSGRKKIYCINVQAICDADYRIMDVNAAWPGSVHDARVWRNSGVFRLMQTGVAGDKLLLGDSAYPISSFMMKPFTEAEAAVDPVKRRFNTYLTKDRVLVENTFGQLKSRFQMLRVPLRIDLAMVPKFILACCILHNVGKDINDNFEDDGNEDNDGDNFDPDDTPDSSANLPSGAAAMRASGMIKRDQIASMLG